MTNKYFGPLKVGHREILMYIKKGNALCEILFTLFDFPGNFRIPKTMISNMDGTRIDPEVKYPKKGIVRGMKDQAGQCTFETKFNAYLCDGFNYKFFIIESMDHDTETRRLSPVGVATQGYIDLINGPQVSSQYL